MRSAARSHFHIADDPDYTMEVQPTGNYAIPKAARDDTEKYAGQTKLMPIPKTGGYSWEGYNAGIPFPNPQEPNKADKIMYNIWAGSYTPFLLHSYSKNWETDSFGNVTAGGNRRQFLPSDGAERPTLSAGTVRRRRQHLRQPLHGAGARAGALHDRVGAGLEGSLQDDRRICVPAQSAPLAAPVQRVALHARSWATDYLADDTDWKPAFFAPEYYGEKKLLVAVADPKTAYTEPSRLGYAGGDYKSGAAFPVGPSPATTIGKCARCTSST